MSSSWQTKSSYSPLCPIPIMGEPFERVIIDCVGPTAPVISKALLKFFSMFGLPKVVQTDQGTNFNSRVFAQVLKTLNIKHMTSTPYHPESQGALESFHQTMKAMLRKYCYD